PTVIKRLHPAEKAARGDVPGVILQALAVVEKGEVMNALQPPYAPTARGEFADEIVGGTVADRAGRTGGLIDVLVIVDNLRAPGGRVVEIMLPASAHDGAAVVPAELRLLGRLRHRRVGK